MAKVKLQSNYSLDPNGMVRQYYQREDDSTINAPSDENWKLGGLKVVPQRKHRRRTQNQVWKTNGFEEASTSSNRKHHKKKNDNWGSSVKKTNHYINEGSAESFYGKVYHNFDDSQRQRALRNAYNAGHRAACYGYYNPPGGMTSSQVFLRVVLFIIFVGFWIFLFVSIASR